MNYIVNDLNEKGKLMGIIIASQLFLNFDAKNLDHYSCISDNEWFMYTTKLINMNLIENTVIQNLKRTLLKTSPFMSLQREFENNEFGLRAEHVFNLAMNEELVKWSYMKNYEHNDRLLQIKVDIYHMLVEVELGKNFLKS